MKKSMLIFSGMVIGGVLLLSTRVHAQLGNTDSCEEFYRLAKQSLWAFDYRLSPEQIDAQKLATRLDPAVSAAYSQLALACYVRQSGNPK